MVGLISHRDLLDRSLAALPEALQSNSTDVSNSIPIKDLIRTEPVTITPEASLETAAIRMLALRIGCLPVAIPSPRGPRLLGLVTEADLLRAAYMAAPAESGV